MDIFKPISRTIGFVNGRKKYYPTPEGFLRLGEVCVFSEPVYNPRNLEGNEPNGSLPQRKERPGNPNACSDSSIRRARSRLFDLVTCNPECNMMLTLTLNGEDFPRDEWAAIIPRLNTWLDNMQRRHGLKYMLVPEYHKDGKSIHFHGFANEDALRLKRAINPKSGKPLLQSGRAVYNVENWRYGFTTAVRVGKEATDGEFAAKYVLKYITKGQEKIGGRYYLHGGDLKEPVVEYFNADYQELDGELWKEFAVTDNLSCKLIRFSAAEDGGALEKMFAPEV